MSGYNWYCKFEMRGDIDMSTNMQKHWKRNPQGVSAAEFGEVVCLAALNAVKS